MTHIPFLEPSFIEAKANQILNTAKAEGLYDGNSHTPLDTICELQLGLQYIYLNLETTHNGEDISGFVNFQNRTVVLNNIEFSDSYHKGRINFTIAHEIGHWILHKKLYEKHIMLHTEFDACTSSLEWQADFFSACLLMPRNLVIQKWQTYKSYSVQEKRVMLADFFRVSLEAMNIRIAHFKLI